MITGCYDMDPAEYHADPCPEPSLSRSIIHALVPPGSPMHAAHKHPRISDCEPPNEPPSRAMQIGSVCHVLMLGKGREIEVIEAESYKKKDAQDARDIAIQEGLLPILVADYDKAERIASAGRRQFISEGITAFRNGDAERTLIWQEEGVWCRAMLDWCPREPAPLDDYKTTMGSAHPAIWQHAMFGCGDDIQAAFYTRGWRAVFGEEPGPFRFIVQEQNAPYALSVTQLTERALASANRKIDYAVRTWRKCLDTGEWPGYTMGYQIDVPLYREFFEEVE
jgi:PDDEXK-like uncharacterized protein DUF3799